jgi:hypothetical protein
MMRPVKIHHAFMLTLWRMNERHDLRRAATACNDNGGV